MKNLLNRNMNEQSKAIQAVNKRPEKMQHDADKAQRSATMNSLINMIKN